MLQSHVQVTDGLSLYALTRVHHEQRTLARGYAAAHFVREIHVPRSVYQVQRIALPLHLNSVALNRDATLFFQIHVVQHLVLHLTWVHRMRILQHPISQRRFAVVDMSYDAKIAYILHLVTLLSTQRYCFFLT